MPLFSYLDGSPKRSTGLVVNPRSVQSSDFDFQAFDVTDKSQHTYSESDCDISFEALHLSRIWFSPNF